MKTHQRLGIAEKISGATRGGIIKPLKDKLHVKTFQGDRQAPPPATQNLTHHKANKTLKYPPNKLL
ncbi:MAG: hypothetical protein ACTHMI_02690 [Mucilaginibacter sp.]